MRKIFDVIKNALDIYSNSTAEVGKVVEAAGDQMAQTVSDARAEIIKDFGESGLPFSAKNAAQQTKKTDSALEGLVDKVIHAAIGKPKPAGKDKPSVVN